jgi:hypothetical protein
MKGGIRVLCSFLFTAWYIVLIAIGFRIGYRVFSFSSSLPDKSSSKQEKWVADPHLLPEEVAVQSPLQFIIQEQK